MFEYCGINGPINTRTCRACLETEYDDCVSLKNNGDILQLYEFCVGILVEPQDVPQVLCNKCVDVLNGFANFKRQCQTSNEFLNSLIHQSKLNAENYSLNKEIKTETDDQAYALDAPVFSHFTCDISQNDTNDSCVNETAEYSNCTEENSKYSNRDNCKNIDVNVIFEQGANDTDIENCHKEGFIKVLECSKCKKQYQKNKCLIKHMKQMCYKKVNVNKLVIVRKYRPVTLKVQKISNELFCGLCSFSSASRSDMRQHFSEHWNANDLQCKLCSYNGKDLAEMVGHRSVHQPYEFFSKSANRVCHICDKRSVTIMRLQFHYRSVHLNKMGGLCSVCSKTFRCYTAWRNHERLHKGSRYICDLCGKKFLFRNQIKAHLADHSDVKGSICDICGKAFKRATYLKEHLNTVHTKEPVKCSHCDKIFKCPANLKEHLKHINKEKNFQCGVCSKYFASPTLVKNHMFWHSGERPHVCEECGAKYKAKSQLKIHMRKHTGQRPYSCEQCDKSFPTSMQLKRHRSVHTGDRPYKCTKCPRSFYYKKLLLVHCTSKHKDENLK